jgi:methylamine dehydrogenase light chain
MKMLDRWIEGSARDLAKRTARRSVLARLGAVLVGGAAAVPLLPVARGAEPSPRVPAPGEPPPDTPAGNPTACEYWRHCAIDGFMCASCGGSQTHCPPGTELSAATWIGICRNPTDSRDYIISYNDCCGKSSCGRGPCNRNEGDSPMYMPAKSNDVNWCMSTTSNVYHCTISVVLGQAGE